MDLPKHLTIIAAQPPCWKVVAVRYFDANKDEGNKSANIYVRGKLKDGSPAVGAGALQTWPDGGNAPKALEFRNWFQIGGDPDTDYAGCDFFMSRDGYRQSHDAPGPYALQMAGNSDRIEGMGLAPNRAHDVYRIEFQWVEAGEVLPTPPPNEAGQNYVTREELADALDDLTESFESLVNACNALARRVRGGIRL